MDLKQFKLPDAGEGLTEADILKWNVQVGDTVVVNQILVEIETAKAAVELPSPFAGVVRELHVAEGDTVDVGRPIITIDVDPSGAVEPSPEIASPEIGSPAEDLVPARQPVLVGYGPKAETAAARRRRKVDVNATEPATEPGANGAFAVPPAPPEPAPAHTQVLAKPPVRKLAKSLGVDLAGVWATGPGGTISRADVEGAASAPPQTPTARHAGGRETRIPIKGVRKHTAAAMVGSAFTAPHVTEFLTADVSATMELRDRVAARREFRDVKVSPLLFVARAVLLAARRTPEINSVWDEAAGEIVLKHYVNLGIAAATDRGLVVPNIKDADGLSLLELAKSMNELTETARAGKTSPSDMSHGTLTITSVGVFGVDSGTPIINPGESAIVCFGAVRRMPWVVDEQIVARWVTQLSVSFDHRLIDGQQGSQFLADVGAVLTDPGLALL
jgi:2-oxoisovalerate dehydrogenase E2 component (dihydrolipoyl transacylase)